MAQHFRTFTQRSIYIDDLAWAKLKEKANSSGMSISAYVREGAISSKLVINKKQPVNLKCFMQLGSIGNNINQIAKHYNTQNQADNENTGELIKLLTHTIEEIRAIRSELL